jgi:hypothetical protein
MGATFTRGKVESKLTMIVSAVNIDLLNAMIKAEESNGWYAIDGHKVIIHQKSNELDVDDESWVEYSITMQK